METAHREENEEIHSLCSKRQYLSLRSDLGSVIFQPWQPNWVIEALSRKTHPWLSLASFCLHYLDLYPTSPPSLVWYVLREKEHKRLINYFPETSWLASGRTMAKWKHKWEGNSAANLCNENTHIHESLHTLSRENLENLLVSALF